VLEVKGLTVDYRGLRALESVSIECDAGQLVSILGPNGAGKTTLLKAISGTVGITAGEIHFAGTDLRTIAPAHRARLGIAHVPEGRRVFPTMTVQDNLEIGARYARTRRFTLETAFDLFPVLAERRRQTAGTLSGGEQQMLALARGLMSSPRMLILDEPTLGLAPAMTDVILERILTIHESQDVAVLLVEQRVMEVLEISQQTYVLESGKLVLSGSSSELRDDPRIRRAYLSM
jgi:branched-chain amino acid transport system ATP-binding protein